MTEKPIKKSPFVLISGLLTILMIFGVFYFLQALGLTQKGVFNLGMISIIAFLFAFCKSLFIVIYESYFYFYDRPIKSPVHWFLLVFKDQILRLLLWIVAIIVLLLFLSMIILAFGFLFKVEYTHLLLFSAHPVVIIITIVLLAFFSLYFHLITLHWNSPYTSYHVPFFIANTQTLNNLLKRYKNNKWLYLIFFILIIANFFVPFSMIYWFLFILLFFYMYSLTLVIDRYQTILLTNKE